MNEHRFTGMGGIYAQFRPSYPPEFIDYLYTEQGFTPDSVIADIGSGTGKLSAQLLSRGSVVYGVEPNPDMRREAERALADCAGFRSVAASAEHTGLTDRGINFVTVAQAFHWFDRAAFRLECQRILRPCGLVVLVWNSRDEDCAMIRENDALNREYCPEFTGFSGGMRGEPPEAYADFFRDGYCEYRVFRNDIYLEREGFIGRNLSSSYALKQRDARYDGYVAALGALFDRYAENGRLCMPYDTKSYAGAV